MKMHWTILPIIVIGVAIGTLIALYVAAIVAQKKLQETQSNNLLLSALGGL